MVGFLICLPEIDWGMVLHIAVTVNVPQLVVIKINNCEKRFISV